MAIFCHGTLSILAAIFGSGSALEVGRNDTARPVLGEHYGKGEY